jgi:hypothetical protein
MNMGGNDSLNLDLQRRRCRATCWRIVAEVEALTSLTVFTTVAETPCPGVPQHQSGRLALPDEEAEGSFRTNSQYLF